MANTERLTKRVKKMEDWVAENEGGPTLNNMNYMLDMLRNASTQVMQLDNQMKSYRSLVEEFFQDKGCGDDWNAWLKQKEDEKNAVQEQQTEEDAVQEEAESSEEASEAPKEEEG